MSQFPSELLSVSSDRGSVGLNDIEETITAQTAWFIGSMVSGKRDTEAKQLLLDTLEEIKHTQTFQHENVFQSSNRLEYVKNTYLKWCAQRMHTQGITLNNGSIHRNCDDCNIARYVPTTILKKQFKGGITNRSQLMVGVRVMSLKEIKNKFPGCKIGTRSHELLTIMVSQMNECECTPTLETNARVSVEQTLMIGQYPVEGREQIQLRMEHERLCRIKEIGGLWWLQVEAMDGGVDCSFLKYPHKIDRKLEWFYAQVRSGTLHTREVMRVFYGKNEAPTVCERCNKESETILHCLIRCPRAILTRRMAMSVGDELSGLGVHPKHQIDLWFDSVCWKGEGLHQAARRSSPKAALAKKIGSDFGEWLTRVQVIKKSPKRFVACVTVVDDIYPFVEFFNRDKKMSGCKAALKHNVDCAKKVVLHGVKGKTEDDIKAMLGATKVNNVLKKHNTAFVVMEAETYAEALFRNVKSKRFLQRPRDPVKVVSKRPTNMYHELLATTVTQEPITTNANDEDARNREFEIFRSKAW